MNVKHSFTLVLDHISDKTDPQKNNLYFPWGYDFPHSNSSNDTSSSCQKIKRKLTYDDLV